MPATLPAPRPVAAGAPITRPITRPLRTRREYDVAVLEIDALLDGHFPAGSPEEDRLALLSVLVEAYETDHELDLEDPTPIEAVTFALEQHGMTRADLADVMGGRSRVSDFFNGKRDLSITQIAVLRDLLRIPADLLIASPTTPPPRTRGRKRA